MCEKSKYLIGNYILKTLTIFVYFRIKQSFDLIFQVSYVKALKNIYTVPYPLLLYSIAEQNVSDDQIFFKKRRKSRQKR